MRRVVLAAAFLATACSQSSGTVIGVVIDVNGDLEEVRSFTLLVEGDEMTFVPSSEGEYAYPLSHLRDHLRDGIPVRVGWERRDGELIAVRLDDG
jgi:sporulation protein YlmC with PRC-barrel domain